MKLLLLMFLINTVTHYFPFDPLWISEAIYGSHIYTCNPHSLLNIQAMRDSPLLLNKRILCPSFGQGFVTDLTNKQTDKILQILEMWIPDLYYPFLVFYNLETVSQTISDNSITADTYLPVRPS